MASCCANLIHSFSPYEVSHSPLGGPLNRAEERLARCLLAAEEDNPTLAKVITYTRTLIPAIFIVAAGSTGCLIALKVRQANGALKKIMVLALLCTTAFFFLKLWADLVEPVCLDFDSALWRQRFEVRLVDSLGGKEAFNRLPKFNLVNNPIPDEVIQRTAPISVGIDTVHNRCTIFFCVRDYTSQGKNFLKILELVVTFPQLNVYRATRTNIFLLNDESAIINDNNESLDFVKQLKANEQQRFSLSNC